MIVIVCNTSEKHSNIRPLGLYRKDTGESSFDMYLFPAFHDLAGIQKV